jgi:hypothetical protein
MTVEVAVVVQTDLLQDFGLMSDPRPVKELVQLGRQAAARGSWREAYDVLVAVDPAELAPEDLELIGEATSWSGPSESCIEARELHRFPRRVAAKTCQSHAAIRVEGSGIAQPSTRPADYERSAACAREPRPRVRDLAATRLLRTERSADGEVVRGERGELEG